MVSNSCDPMDSSLPGSSVHGISQARIWSGLPFPSPKDLPNPGIEPRSPELQADSLPTELQGKCLLNCKVQKDDCEGKKKVKVLVAKLCPSLCNPIGYSPLGSSVHGIFQARVPEWIVISFSRISSQPRDRTQVSHITGRRFTL